MTVLIRNIVVCTLLFCWYNVAFAQTYGNEWIQYDQKYYSFKVYPPTIPSPSPVHEFEDIDNIYSGIQRIDYDALVASAIPITIFNTENIQIFAREKEIPIHIEDGGDSSMDPGDYILFYTERNDGWLDSTLYIDPNDLGNALYSMYNDTIEYFFTWNTSTSNLRYTAENDTDFNSYTPADYVLYDRWRSNSYLYVEGEHVSDATSSFNASIEGWSHWKRNGVPSGFSWSGLISLFDINSVYQGANAPDVKFDCTIIGASDAAFGDTGNHHVLATVGPSNFVLNDSIWIGYKGIRLHSEFSSSILPASGDPNFDIKIIDDQNATTDYQSVPFWFFKYPRIPDFDGADKVIFESPNSSIESKIRLDISNVSFNNAIILVHGDIPRKVRVAQNGPFYSALIPNSTNGVDQEVFYQDSSTITSVPLLYPINGNGQFTDFGSIGNLEDALLMVTHPLLDPASTEYVNYRSSAAGGLYNVIRADINELYQQFGGGIPKHINGVRRFAHFMYNNATNKPVGLFLLGKGIKEDNVSLEGTRRFSAIYSESLIPSFGYPSSDICITANLEGSYNWAPLIATGRISAQTNTELQDYLNKVKEYEIEQDPFDIYDTPNKDWQKQILHFSGGSDAAQQLQFSGFLDQMKLTIEDSLFGGNVTSVYKATSDPLDPTVLGSVTDRIEQGVSLMNYFGHASATNSGFELNLDDPENWNNQGKYPLMLVNSCYNGNLFSTNISKSEKFVQVPNAGAIGYIASVHLGFDTYLNTYAQELYKQFSRKAYGLTLGEQMKRTTEYIESSFTQNLFLEASCTQMILNGDPMLRLNHHDNPEIELTQQSVTFSPSSFDLSVDSIEMTIILKNLGRSVTDTTVLEVTRNFPGTVVDSTYLIPIPELHYTYEHTLKMPLQPSIGIGLNNFTIKIDLPSTVNEQYDEINNNQISKTLFIDIDGIVPVEPYDFAVVPEDSVSIIASTINPIAEFNTYRFEIDTIDFEGAPSPEHRFALVSAFGGVQEVRPSEWILTASPPEDGTLQCTDSTVYFWRVSIDGDTTWRESSFQYINGKQGWGQDHFFQFKNNAFTGIEYNRPTRDRDFLQGVQSTVRCDVFTTTSSPGYYYNAWYFDGDLMGYGICNLVPKLHVVVIDPVTHDHWKTRNTILGVNLNNDFGNQNDEGDCLPVMTFFTFPQNDPAYLSAFQNMVNTEVPDGYYMLIYSPMTTRYDWWNSIDSVGMYNTFLALGSDSINGNRPNRPFAFFCKKGDASSVVELYVQNADPDEITLTGSILGDGTGSENTPLIGPANKWNGIYWKQDPEESPSGDTTYLTIEVFDHNMNYQYQIDTLFTLNDSIINLNATLINAVLFPYIKLRATYEDPVTDTPAAIDRWHVLFNPMPEAAIDGSTQYTWTSNDTISEGTEVSFAVDIKNIFTLDMDSLLVNYWIEDQQQYEHIIPYPRQGELLVGDVLRDTITFSTLGIPGLNSLRVEVNPYVNGSLSITDQPEQAHFNNLLQLPFYVRPDSINPILDVTFNGNHILNGDIIDPSSEILITLKDENEFLVMDNVSDTALFGIYITDPAGQLIKIPFVDGIGNTVMQWIPANSQNKRFKIIWPTDFTLDGEYTLLVQGADKSGNLSGDIEYRVTFEIIHESSITKMMNYPNPFSTSTRFVFTLTGSVEPDDIIIQIMTVSGRVVREITEDQLGHIQIGRNISEYAWNGTDEFGDPLANGVYLYRVKARINGEEIKHRDSGADTYFKKDFGKMYILR